VSHQCLLVVFPTWATHSALFWFEVLFLLVVFEMRSCLMLRQTCTTIPLICASLPGWDDRCILPCPSMSWYGVLWTFALLDL
jgi:hypothetical protein